MTGLTNYITECDWSDLFLTWLVLVDDAYLEIAGSMPTGKIPGRSRGPQPVMSDSEVITISLIIETLFHGNEELGLSFMRQYHLDMFPHLLDNSRFNRRRRSLAGITEAIRQQLTTELISPTDNVRLIDSAPMPVCTYIRGHQCATVLGQEYCGVMVSKRAKLYGLRLHMTTSTDQVVDRWMLAPASHYDATMAPALLEDSRAGLFVIGDNAFHSPAASEWLKSQRDTTLWGMPRRYGRSAKAWEEWRDPAKVRVRRFLNRMRRRIETALSVLCGVFDIERAGSHSLAGLITRTATRLLAYNLSFLVAPLLQTSN